MKIKTSELKEGALDWAVAKCKGLEIHKDAVLNGVIKHGVWLSGLNIDPNNWTPLVMFNPSTDWSQGGPIIEREEFDLCPYDPAGMGWRCTTRKADYTRPPERQYSAEFGPLPLIAAMRCYVASKLGDEVEIPNELIGEQA